MKHQLGFRQRAYILSLLLTIPFPPFLHILHHFGLAKQVYRNSKANHSSRRIQEDDWLDFLGQFLL